MKSLSCNLYIDAFTFQPVSLCSYLYTRYRVRISYAQSSLSRGLGKMLFVPAIGSRPDHSYWRVAFCLKKKKKFGNNWKLISASAALIDGKSFVPRFHIRKCDWLIQLSWKILFSRGCNERIVFFLEKKKVCSCPTLAGSWTRGYSMSSWVIAQLNIWGSLRIKPDFYLNPMDFRGIRVRVKWK